jgi:hypothetical protein
MTTSFRLEDEQCTVNVVHILKRSMVLYILYARTISSTSSTTWEGWHK